MRSLLDEPHVTDEFETSPKPRLRRSLRRLKLTRRKVIVVAAIVVALCAASTWLLYFSSVLALKQVVVQGVRAISPSEVVAQAQLHSGEPLASIDTDLVAARIAGMNTVAHVEVWQRWPDTVVIDVVERDRVAAVKSGGQFDILDQTGFAVEHKKRRPEKIPLLQAADDHGKQSALSLLHGFPPELARLVRSVTVTAASGDQIVLALDDGITVIWGDSQDSEEKTKVLRALLGHLGSDKWVDVRSPTNPSSAKTSPTPAPPPPTHTPKTTPTPTPTPTASSSTGSVPPPSPASPTGDGDAVPVSPPATYLLPG